MLDARQISKQLGLSLEMVEGMLPLAVVKKIKNKEILIQFGSYVNKAYIVLEGGFVIEHLEDKSGHISTVNFFMPEHNPLMTASESYFQNIPSSFRIQAFKNSTILIFKKSQINEYVSNNAVFARYYYEKIIDAFINQQRLRAKLLAMDSKDFFLYIREHYPILFLQVPSIYLSRFMKITPQWLSKLKREF